MKKRLLFLSLLVTLVVFNSCQKELSVESGGAVSLGTLQSDAGGECLPKNVAGSYAVGKALVGTTNYIDVEVNVIQTGSYLIYTDTAEGIHFRASGIFTATGLNTVRLAGNGTPTKAGLSNFIVTYGPTECVVVVLITPPGGATPAAFTFNGAPGVCTGAAATITGNYVTGVALTSANTATITVNVTTIGTYTITTATSNGIIFSGTNVLTGTGLQTIVLTASGTPAAAGPTTIAVTNGAGSACSFIVTVTSTPVVADYYPRTVNSNWSYEYDNDPDDSVLVVATNLTKTVSGNVFTIFGVSYDATPGLDSGGYYRKAGADYSEFFDIGTRYGLDGPLWGEIIFLKDNVAANGTWLSNSFTGVAGGAPLTFRFKYIINQKDVVIVVNGITFPNTIVVDEKIEFNIAGVWTDVSSGIGYIKSFYSRNVGLIRQEVYEAGSTLASSQEIRRYQVL